jgi:cysteine desulfurase family protein (TIGR01976 family)
MFDVEAVRACFPALHVPDDGRPRVYLDAPGGTQVCDRAIERMVAHMRGGTANAGGAFATSIEADALWRAAHVAVADLLAADASEIAFGPNMTTLTLAASRALGRGMRPGDNLVVTRLDHDANVAPWLHLARDLGLEPRWLDFAPDTGRLRLDLLPGLLDERTRLVAVGGASNALGTVNDLQAISAIVRERSDALIFVDAVQSVPHYPVEVRAIGCDLLACSPYKFYGPHQGVLWGRAELLAGIEAYKLRPSPTEPVAIRFETGTPSYEGLAGTLGAIEHIEWVGREFAEPGDRAPFAHLGDRSATLHAGMAAIARYERRLTEAALDALLALPRLRLHGPRTAEGRGPTFAFTIDGHAPRAVAEHLAARGIFAWSGSFYAQEAIERLGVAAGGGVVRVGFCHYNRPDEIDRLVEALASL